MKSIFSNKNILRLSNIKNYTKSFGVISKKKIYNLEEYYNGNYIKAINERRKLKNIDNYIPICEFDYNKFYGEVYKKNCEMVIGYIPIPIGVVGPLIIDGTTYENIPLGTTEGALVASTNRGCKAITESGGINCYILNNSMNRAPIIRMSTVNEAINVKKWIENEKNLQKLKETFKKTTNYGELLYINTKIVGRNIYIKFFCSTGDAMGMNIVSKGAAACIHELQSEIEHVEVLSLSGNTCMDKKSSAINIIEGRGKYVIAETIIKKNILEKIFKINVEKLIELNFKKNYIGSSISGSIGGNNAHASNIVSAIFLATGQDIAQNIESSSCFTVMEKDIDDNLHMTVTLPCLEVGTVGGGTHLLAQKNALKLLNINGNLDIGEDSINLAKIIASTVLAGELSLMSALANNDLVSAHLKYNRK
jgi:hydroxymethylglutaryl-CoA reductase (NADPH)